MKTNLTRPAVSTALAILMCAQGQCEIGLEPTPVKTTTQNTAVTAKAEIPTILELNISEQGQAELNFGVIRPLADQPAELGPIVIKVDVRSNIGSRYIVSHVMNRRLENGAGDTIPSENLKFTSTPEQTRGTGVAAPMAMGTQAQTVFLSDEAGSSDTIDLEYRLTVPPAQPPGDYATLLTYTVSSA
jgi:hypothetical protein